MVDFLVLVIFCPTCTAVLVVVLVEIDALLVLRNVPALLVEAASGSVVVLLLFVNIRRLLRGGLCEVASWPMAGAVLRPRVVRRVVLLTRPVVVVTLESSVVVVVLLTMEDLRGLFRLVLGLTLSSSALLLVVEDDFGFFLTTFSFFSSSPLLSLMILSYRKSDGTIVPGDWYWFIVLVLLIVSSKVMVSSGLKAPSLFLVDVQCRSLLVGPILKYLFQ